jgi:hypothetical protein
MSAALPRGTSFVIPAFDSLQRLVQETAMAFSMPSYLLGVGTVVGALTLGFGGGVLLTKTAIKEPSGPSKMERAARAEPSPTAPVVTEAKAVPVPRADPAPVIASGPPPAPQVQAAAAPAPQAQPAAAPQVQAAVAPPQVQSNPAPANPVAEARRDETPQVADPLKQVQPVRQAEAPKQLQQREAEPSMSARELRRAEREQRRMERRAERERHYAERKARTIEFVRMRQRPAEEREQPTRPELAFEREEPKPNLFEGLFGRPRDAAPAERE